MLMLAITTHLEVQISRFQQAERGGSLVEYALLLALIALATFAAVTSFGSTVSSQYVPIGSSLAG